MSTRAWSALGMIVALFGVVIAAGSLATVPSGHAARLTERCPAPPTAGGEEARNVYDACVARYRSTVPAAYMTPSGLEIRVEDP